MNKEEIIKEHKEFMWSKNFYNAKRFFGTKGNIKTKSRLKDKWSKEFQEDIKKLIE